MIKQVEQNQEGRAVTYYSSVLETNLFLESLGFLLLNAERHYYTVYPTLINLHDQEIRYIAMDDMKQSIAAGLSSLHEFIAQRMKLDQEDYKQAIDRFQQEIEKEIANSELLLKIYDILQNILQLEGINKLGELQTIKEMLTEMNTFLEQLLPESIKYKKQETPVIPIKQNIDLKEIDKDIKQAQPTAILPLILNFHNLGLLNYLDHQCILIFIHKIIPEDILAICQLLPQKSINKEVAKAIINKRRETHYISTLTELKTDITNKETLLKLLESAPEKRWYLQ
jgi:hypothetical protein